jgi:endoribonuclease LACTB2
MRVIPIRAENAGPMTGRGTNTYLIAGTEPTLIDAAEDSDAYADRVAAALEAIQPGASLSRVLITHAHRDHIAGVAAIARRWPAASWAKIPLPDIDRQYRVEWSPVHDGQLIAAGDASLWAVATPGHAPDHAVFVDVRTSGVFCGDLVMNGGTVTIPPSKGGHLGQYLDSLRRLLDLQPRRLFPGHGPIVENPGALIRAYIGHRVGREQQVLDALRLGSVSPAEIARRIYPADLGANLWPAAEENVLAHLIKLREDDRAVQDGERWQLRTQAGGVDTDGSKT